MFNRLITAYNKYQKQRATINELYSLTDRELNDIGLNRGDVLRVAKKSTR